MIRILVVEDEPGIAFGLDRIGELLAWHGGAGRGGAPRSRSP